MKNPHRESNPLSTGSTSCATAYPVLSLYVANKVPEVGQSTYLILLVKSIRQSKKLSVLRVQNCNLEVDSQKNVLGSER